MLNLLKQSIFPITVFITGACVLIVEVVATRILSPFYGNTIFTVSSVISVILAALSFGYYIGGRLADRYTSLGIFFSIIWISGLVLLILHTLGIYVLPYFSSNLSMTTGPIVSSLLLFLLPAFLLGMLSPYAIKLQSISSPNQGIGSISGNIYFWSTSGSILGSLLAGFVLIPTFGINEIMIANSLVLFLLGFVPLLLIKSKFLKINIIGLLIFIIILLVSSQISLGEFIYYQDGIYEKIAVFDSEFNNRPTRFLQLDRSKSGAMYLDSNDPKDMVYDYTKYYILYKIFNPNIQKALVLGGGAYSIPKALITESPNISVDVSEIEPRLYNLAKQYFNLTDNPQLHNYAKDGRRFLLDTPQKYDLIFSDVYYSIYFIPTHFTTQEFFEIAKSKLNPNGILIINVVGELAQNEPSFLMSEIKTFQSVFSNCYFIAVESPTKAESQNIIFIAFNNGEKIDFNTELIANDPNSVVNTIPNKLIDTNKFDLSKYPIFTDNFAPVDYYIGQELKRNN